MPASPPHRFALTACWVVPVDQPPIRDGIVVIEDSRIIEVGPRTAATTPIDLGEVAILPGLVNAHTHLEFSDLSTPLGEAGTGFSDWIRFVVAHRRAINPSAFEHAKSNVVETGLRESLTEGVATLGEIATTPWPRDVFMASPIHATLFLELKGTKPDKVAEQIEQARQHIAQNSECNSSWRAGLSPHAPYSTSIDLIKQAVELSRANDLPVAMHLAESREELELLESHSGPMVELLQSLDAWSPSARPRGTTPLDYLRLLSTCPQTLIIHGNYLDAASIDFLGSHSDRMSVVYCPRTHAYFQHDRYPLSEMLAAGVRVALGTDSRASNPDLSLLSEMRQVAHSFPEISPEVILSMGTLHAAAALGLASEKGSLTPGKQADMTVVRLSDSSTTNPVASLLNEACPVDALYIAGKRMES